MLDTGSLTFLWPSMLWLLIAVPLAAALYWALAARRRKSSTQYASLETVGGQTANAASRMRRMLPLLLWTLALTALILAIARPQAALHCRRDSTRSFLRSTCRTACALPTSNRIA